MNAFRLVRILSGAAFLLLVPFFIGSCSDAPQDRFQGYVEGEFVYVASPLAGQLESLQVRRGDQVKAGDPLFALDETAEKAALDQARAALVLSEAEFARQEKLFRMGPAAAQDYDRARSTRDQDRQRVTQAEWNFNQKRQAAPQAGLVYDTLFRQGEWVAAGKPVVVLLPPQNIKVRAFVPETQVGSIHYGDTTRVSVDGVPDLFSGKTTFLRMLCGLLRADDGSGRVLGHDVIAESEAIKREVGYMTQRFSFWEDLSIEENLDFVARMYDVKNRRQTVRESIEQLGLAERKDQLAGELSGGWKQRLALAACLIHRPKLLLLDEPTAGVDPKARRDFWEQIHQLAAQALTFLITTHYMDEAERCQRLAYISKGKLLAAGTVDEVISRVGLTTWSVRGRDLAQLAEQLRKTPGVQQAVAFGNSLHVSSTDAAALERAIAPFRHEPYDWRQIPSGLEDAFISLMEHDRSTA